MNNRRILLVLPLLAFTSLFCSLGLPGLPEGIQQTLESLTQQVPAIETQFAQQMTEAAPILTQIALTAVPDAGSTGSIAGSLSYPSEFIPPLRVVAFRTDINQYYYVDTFENQGAYQIDNLPVGTYHVVAYTMDGGLAGGFTQAVPCGLSVDCPDHTLIDVPVNAGGVSTGVDPGDWYAPEGTYPPKP
jgi:hypothetical protein